MPLKIITAKTNSHAEAELAHAVIEAEAAGEDVVAVMPRAPRTSPGWIIVTRRGTTVEQRITKAGDTSWVGRL